MSVQGCHANKRSFTLAHPEEDYRNKTSLFEFVKHENERSLFSFAGSKRLTLCRAPRSADDTKGATRVGKLQRKSSSQGRT